MLDQIESQNTESQKVVALKFRKRIGQRMSQKHDERAERFAQVDQLMDEMFSKEKLLCA